MPEGDAIPRPALIVGLLALVPFLILLILAYSLPAADRFVPALRAYDAPLAALFGGAHWAFAAGPYGKARIRAEFLIGLGLLMAAWLASIVAIAPGFAVLIAAYFLVLLRDALKPAAAPAWFLRLRAYIAAGAVISSVLALIRVLI